MFDYIGIIKMLSEKHKIEVLKINSKYFNSIIYVKNQFLCFNRDFIVVFSAVKYRNNIENKTIQELEKLEVPMPKQINSHDCLLVCECEEFPNDSSVYSRKWAIHTLLINKDTSIINREFWFGGAGKIKKVAHDIQQQFRP